MVQTQLQPDGASGTANAQGLPQVDIPRPLPAAEPAPSPAPVTYTTDIYCPKGGLPEPFVSLVKALEHQLERKVFLLVQGLQGDNAPSSKEATELGLNVRDCLWARRSALPREKIALLLDSPGGDAKATYQIANLLNKVCGGYSVVVPRYAKSAATLLCLGADEITMSGLAELGPLDVQHRESVRKRFNSALNEKQSVERLHTSALEAIDRTTFFLVPRLQLSSEEIEHFLPIVMNYVANEFRPLFEKLDVVHWAQVSRLLKIGEDYAVRLLGKNYKDIMAQRIAHALVEAYPDHGFVIDDCEARRIGLEINTPDGELARIVDGLFDYMGKLSAVGFLKESAGGA